jgi:hypothetical protein
VFGRIPIRGHCQSISLELMKCLKTLSGAANSTGLQRAALSKAKRRIHFAAYVVSLGARDRISPAFFAASMGIVIHAYANPPSSRYAIFHIDSLKNTHHLGLGCFATAAEHLTLQDLLMHSINGVPLLSSASLGASALTSGAERPALSDAQLLLVPVDSLISHHLNIRQG